MKVLLIGNSDICIYTFRKELVDKLLQEGHKVFILAPYGKLIDDLKKAGCVFYDTPLSRRGKNILKDLKLLRNYKKTIGEIKPDIVFTFTIKPNIYGALASAKYNVPCVMNITGLGSAVENKGITQKITLFLYRKALKKVQTVFFQNEENMRFFADRNLGTGKHKLLPGSGVNLKKFAYADYPSENNGLVFLFLSRIMKEKGIDQYLQAAEYLKGKYPGLKFNICGYCEEAYQQRLEDLQSKGIIFYYGLKKDVVPIIKESHCLVHPTYYPEGLSNVLLESCACGRPVITTDRSGCREVVENGVNGFFCKQKDAEDLIRCILKFMNLSAEERRTMGLNGRKKVEREFDRNIVVKAYLDEIKKLNG